MRLLLQNVEVEGLIRNVLVRDGKIESITDPSPATSIAERVDGRGGALLPGLHDHHLHLLAMAAQLSSIPCGPPLVRDGDDLARALKQRAAAGPERRWLRGTGYHEQVAGTLDAQAIDRFVSDRPVRIQHRSGALWMLNSAALSEINHVLDNSPDVERDKLGRANGRLWRYDERLRAALPAAAPDLKPVGKMLSQYGITSVTDATPNLDSATMDLISLAEGFPQAVRFLGAPLGRSEDRSAGPWKILIRDHDLPSVDSLTFEITRAHTEGRPVAIHCVTRASIILTLAAIEAAGAVTGDRIEHGSVIPPELHEWLRRLGVAIVTQPGFLRARGDDYLQDVEPHDRQHLYPYRSLLAAGIPTVPSSDAPFGPLDPWLIMRAARDRRTQSGRIVGSKQRVSAAASLAGYLSHPDAPGRTARRISVGAIADLVLLEGSLAECVDQPDADRVRLVLRDGVPIHVSA